jgi:iron complex transport system substrate-binding protein
VIIRLLKGDIKANIHHELAVSEQANHASHQRKPANTIQKIIFLYFSPIVATIFTSPGDVYEKRVMVEPGNCWVAEFVRLAGANYLFDDVFGSACIEISLERFITSGKEADTLFTYRTANVGVTSKEAMARTNPAVERIGPIQDGKVLSPLPHYAQSADRLDEILEEVASILHPDLFPKESRNFFAELPDRDNLRKEGE